MKESSQNAPNHVPENWLYHDSELTGKEANQIIEEIMVILTKRKITIMTAKQVLKDTMKALDQETILENRRVDGEIIRADRLFHGENELDVQTLGGYMNLGE